MANRALVYTIYPNEKQNIQCQKTFGCCRFVYNQMLDVQKERHENGEKHLSKTKANTYCNQHLKKKYPFLKEVDSPAYDVEYNEDDIIERVSNELNVEINNIFVDGDKYCAAIYFTVKKLEQ